MIDHVTCGSARRVLEICAIMALTLFQGVPNASAQSTFGSSIIGTVQDTAGAAVPGVTLTVINLTDEAGSRR